MLRRAAPLTVRPEWLSVSRTNSRYEERGRNAAVDGNGSNEQRSKRPDSRVAAPLGLGAGSWL